MLFNNLIKNLDNKFDISLYGTFDMERFRVIQETMKYGNLGISSFLEKTAFCVRELIQTHPLLDGNKRYATTFLCTVLKKYGYEYIGTPKNLLDFGIEIARDTNKPIEWIVTWIEKYFTNH